jgi:predicted double-glycine peptidase
MKNIIYIIILIISLCLGSRVSVCASNFKILSMKELREVDMIRQTHEYSCGAAALATLMNMFGNKITEAEVLSSIFGDKLPLIIDKDGKLKLRALTLSDLEKSAHFFGFKVISVQVPNNRNIINILQSLKPAITRMYLYKTYLHFVVLRDINNEWVYISDPAYGNFKIPFTQFLKAWDAGDRILLTISKYPFDAWEDNKENTISLSRNPKEKIKVQNVFNLKEFYKTVQKKIYQINSFSGR